MADKQYNITYNFSKQTVLITGAATGIGYAIAEMFAQSKANIILVDKSTDIGEKANTLAKKYKVKTAGIECDITDTHSLSQMKETALHAFSQVDILVNNAGIAVLEKAETLAKEHWDATLAVNLSAAFFVTQSFVPEMIQRKKGKIVNIASQAGVIALDKHVAYCVSKAGIISMTKVMALEWGKYNININAVSPTVVLTELGKKAWAGKIGEDMKKKIPTKRFAFPEEIAATVMFLSSAASDMVHGENILIDGGYSIQ